ncbi:MAG: hypothetical protein ABI771_12365 [Betaproteobacteria bacterium]
MKPTLPEDREPDEPGADVSERYREVVRDEPPSRLDARILEAARREVAQPPRRNWLRIPVRREWQVPASIAAVLVLAVSLGLVVGDNEPPLVPADGFGAGHPSVEEAKLAKASPPQLAMKDKARSNVASDRESRPSRDRSERPDRQLLARAAPSSSQSSNAAAPAIQEVPATQPAQALPPAAAPAPYVADAAVAAKSREPEQAPAAEGAAEREKKKTESSDALTGRIAAVQGLRKQDNAKQIADAKDWVRRLEELLTAGKQAEARDQLTIFRARYPDYPLPERLQALLPPQR